MPEGTIQAEIKKVEQAFSAIQALVGAPGGGGFAGGAAVSANAPGAQVGSFQGSFSANISGTFRFDAQSSLRDATGFFAQLRQDAALQPTDALAAFTSQMGQLDSAFGADFTGEAASVLAAVKGISSGIPADRTAVVGALVDQILRTLSALNGPEADTIRAWLEAAREMQLRLQPIVDQAQHAADPAAALVTVIERALGSTLDTFGFADVRKFFAMLEGFADRAVPATALTALTGAHGPAMAALDAAKGAVNASFPEFRQAAVAVAMALNVIRENLREAAIVLRRVAEAKFLQPHALETFLKKKLDEALGVEVQDTQRIKDPFQAMFDKVDAAIAGIDLSFVRNDVLGFFERTRQTLGQVNIPNLGEQLKSRLEPVRRAVTELQNGVDGLLRRIREFFEGLTQKYRDLASRAGEFAEDGTFHFTVEQQLRDLLGNARTFIEGDVAHMLSDLKETVRGFVEQLTGVLQPVQAAIGNAAASAVGAANDFSAFLTGLDIPGLIKKLADQVKQIVDSVGTIKFDVVVDPVIGGIHENTEKLRSIDPSKINDLLRAALKTALDVVISIDFTASVKDPLKTEFAKVKALPKQGIDEIQHRYEQAVSSLDKLKPTELLKALFDAFDVIQKAAGSLSIAPLLKPLDDLHKQFLETPLAQLKPSVLLKPVADAFHDATSRFTTLSGAALIAPVDHLLNSVKAKIAQFDISKFIDELLQAVEKIKHDMQQIRPSEILNRLLPELARLEQELDRFKPSTLLQPLTSLAQPLLNFLENIQQQTIQTLFNLFQEPLRFLDRLRPQALTAEIQHQLDSLTARLDAVNVPGLLTQLKGKFFDLNVAVEAQGSSARLNLTTFLCDPERALGELLATYNDLVTIIKGLRNNVELPSLEALYGQAKDKLLDLAPAYARELLDPERFKRLLRLADPTRFAEELDTRFEAVKQKLLPIKPQDIAAELDQTYEAVLAQVEGLNPAPALNEVKQIFSQLSGIVASIRVDFLARDIDRAVADFRAVINALDPSRLFQDLDSIHHAVEQAVASTMPSSLLGELQQPLDDVKAVVASVNPRTLIGEPLDQAWAGVEGALKAIDFRVILGPLVEKLNEIETEFLGSIQKTESAFDEMLGVASAALGGNVSASVSVSI